MFLFLVILLLVIPALPNIGALLENALKTERMRQQKSDDGTRVSA
jgi:hypothetical protein